LHISFHQLKKKSGKSFLLPMATFGTYYFALAFAAGLALGKIDALLIKGTVYCRLKINPCSFMHNGNNNEFDTLSTFNKNSLTTVKRWKPYYWNLAANPTDANSFFSREEEGNDDVAFQGSSAEMTTAMARQTSQQMNMEGSSTGGSQKTFNVVLTHCTADFDSLASAVGLAKLWDSPSHTHSGSIHKSDSNEIKTEGTNASVAALDDSKPITKIPTYVVLPRGAHPAVQRFLALHKHLFPIRSLKSLPSDLSGLNWLGLVDAQRRDRVGPAEPLLQHAKQVLIMDHHIDSESDIPEATDYIVDHVGSVSTMVVERLMKAGVALTEAEATLLALGIHADTGSLRFDSTTVRDAKALAWVMAQGASQAAIAEHAKSSLSEEQQGVLTQALLNTNSSVVHGVTVSSVLLSTEGFINGLAAVTQDALELTGSDVMLLAVVYDPKASSSSRSNNNDSSSSTSLRKKIGALNEGKLHSQIFSGSFPPATHIMHAEAWKGGEEMFKRKRLRAAFEKRDSDGSGYLERREVSAALASSGVISSDVRSLNLFYECFSLQALTNGNTITFLFPLP
jgi:nanoRNase/pAp phosphatase (c-di-AMP/oligoRNAs hydrolase)